MCILLYSNDTIVLAETELQSALDAVHEYCNNMHLNNATMFLHFAKSFMISKDRKKNFMLIWAHLHIFLGGGKKILWLFLKTII